MYTTVYQKQYIADFEACRKGKILYFFSAGDSLKKRISWLKQYDPVGIFDNNKSKAGTEMEGIPILYWSESVAKKLQHKGYCFLGIFSVIF